MPALPRSNIHLDILMGRDETVDVTDVFNGKSTLIIISYSTLNIYFCLREGNNNIVGHTRGHGTQTTHVILFL